MTSILPCVIVSIILAYSVLPIESLNVIGPFAPDVAVYEGSFAEGGRYRMICRDATNDRTVFYGSIAVSLIFREGVEQIYVEEYKRVDTVYLEVNAVDSNGSSLSSTPNVYKISDAYAIPTTNGELYRFVKGPVLLKLDIGVGAPINPRILRLESFYGSATSYAFLSLSDYIRSPSWIGKPGYLVSTVYNSDLPLDSRGRTTSIISFTSFRVSVEKVSSHHRVMLEAKHLKYIVDPISGSINSVSEISLPEGYWKPSVQLCGVLIKESLAITIDISRSSEVVTNLIAVRNVSKGDWLYSNYKVVLFSDVKSVEVEVVNTPMDAVIYKSPSGVLLTRVERFVNVHTEVEYLITHELRPSEDQFIPHTHIFELVDENGHRYYVDHFKIRKWHLESVLRPIADEGMPDSLSAASQGFSISIEDDGSAES
ncbi:uncharacterized protein BXIN_2904 [Babesia sp. Xinjiang]|uniref:uncharacterized protein n=1 Tax=Babesia sp. Xinjiang TaxID=462227 RepID=UPI000A21C06A|nr:uncharacterized protein BXIN_2904 [Babesia sp. Xinjiang]ORM39577.1 hypothetical protein BXIN_2904 [Babesia sp. Xinjiang]